MAFEWKRTGLYIITALLGTSLFFAWQKDHHAEPATTTSSQQTTTSTDTQYNPQAYLPTTVGGATATTTPAAIINPTSVTPELSPPGKLINVNTDLLNITIDTNGGDIISAKLPKYPVSLEEPHNPIEILTTDPQQFYVAQSGLLAQQNQSPLVIHYQAAQNQYNLADGQATLVVKLLGKTPNGIVIEKDYTFTRNKYAIQLNYQITNPTAQPWTGGFYQQITRGGFLVKASLHSRSYTGPSFSSPSTPYQKIPFKKLTQENISRDVLGGWVAMQQQYFLSAWIPPQNQLNHYYSHMVAPPNSANYSDNIYTVGFYSPFTTINPGQSTQYNSTFYVGPELPDHLKVLAPQLDRTIDYGWLWFISKFIFWLMAHVHSVVGNWGWSIVIVTLMVKAALFWFSARSFHSMAKMRDMQPRIKALKERLGDDRQALSKATMDLYRKEKINPMSGCLPMVAQIPIFFALYYVLIESVQLRQAPFILWIRDLSVHDPYYVLPILMGLSMLAQQKLSPPPPDPTQAKMMMLLPVVFTVFFLSFPAGLVLYWLTNNCSTIVQQWFIMRRYNPKEEREKERKKKKKKKSISL